MFLDFAKDGHDGQFYLIVPSNTMDAICWEIQDHSGTYFRTHPDGSVEEGKTTRLTLNLPTGRLVIIRDAK